MNPALVAAGQANPGFKLGAPVPAPQPFEAVVPLQQQPIVTVRAQQPGGAVMEYMQSQNVLWFEQMYRKLPPNGIFGARPNRPVTFTMGSFRVPQSMVLFVFDYAFDIYRFSGAAAGDYIPIEPNRLSTQIGWDILVNDNRPANFNFQIIPQEQTQTQQTFAAIKPGIPAQAWQFEQARALQNQGPAGPALSLMPQRRHRSGLVQLANSYVARAGDVLSVTCSVINQIPIPIAFFEVDVTGVLIPQNVYDAYQKQAVPIGNPIPNPTPGGP